MSESSHYRDDSAVFRTPDDRLVVEIRLVGGTRDVLRCLIADAEAASADALWVHGQLLDSALGFEPRGGYARLEAERLSSQVALASPSRQAVRELQIACFSGVWGHAHPGEPDATATYVALHEEGRWVGICEFDAVAGWIDGPSVVRDLRTPDRYQRLVQGAATRIGSGPVTLETWGDTEETLIGYKELGFQIVEYVPRWELKLGTRRVP